MEVTAGIADQEHWSSGAAWSDLEEDATEATVNHLMVWVYVVAHLPSSGIDPIIWA
jgi:hypothetical protein